jgi:pyruvate dehydrogenase E1 component beta subunit
MYREALNEALREEMIRDERVFLIGGGIAQRGGSFKVTVGLLDQFGPRRVIDAPISESSFTGMGVGAAITGMRPVIEILSSIPVLIIDQIVNQAASTASRAAAKAASSVPAPRRQRQPGGPALAEPRSVVLSRTGTQTRDALDTL